MVKGTYRAFLGGLLALSQLAVANLIKEDNATKTLVVVDDWATVETHSVFFDHIRNKLGHKVEFSMSDDSVQKFKHHDAYYFDNIVLMTPSTKGKVPLLRN